MRGCGVLGMYLMFFLEVRCVLDPGFWGQDEASHTR